MTTALLLHVSKNGRIMIVIACSKRLMCVTLFYYVCQNGYYSVVVSYEGTLCSHAISEAHVSHHEEVLAAPAGGQEGQGDGACHTDEQEEEETGA